jgi:hypothetical protein
MHRAHSGLIRVRIEAPQPWVGLAKVSEKIYGEANQGMICASQTKKDRVEKWGRWIRRLKGNERLNAPKPKFSTKEPSSTELRFASFLARLCVACRVVKGQDERSLTVTPLRALYATRGAGDERKKIWRAATSALTFTTFSWKQSKRQWRQRSCRSFRWKGSRGDSASVQAIT